MSINAQNKIYATLLISAIVIVVLLVFLVCPLIDKIKISSANLREKNNLIASFQEKGGNYLKNLQGEYADLESEISKIDRSFVNPEGAIDLIVAVEHLAALTNNYQQIQEIDLAEEEKNILAFRVFSWGSFPDFIKFLAQLENMDYFIDFDSLQITRIEERELGNLENKGIAVSVGDIKSVLEIRAYAK